MEGTERLKNIKGAIFDLDGVIVDTAKYHYLAWKRLANELGFDFSPQDNERLKGVGRLESLEILLGIGGLSCTEDLKLALAEVKNKWYVDYISRMDRSELLPGAEDYLLTLRRNGVRTALGSASKNAPLILDRLQISSCFDAIVEGSMVTRSKPDPQIFLLAAEKLSLAPGDCAVYEDAFAGVEAAKRGGMLAVGIGRAEDLPNADFVVPGLGSLLGAAAR